MTETSPPGEGKTLAGLAAGQKELPKKAGEGQADPRKTSPKKVSSGDGGPGEVPGPGPGAGQERMQGQLRRFEATMVVATLLLWGGASIVQGFDFGWTVLLGSALVCLNYWLTKKAVSRPRVARVAGAFLVKLTFSGVFLYFAIVIWGLSPLGLALGASVLPVAGLGLLFT